MSEQRYDVPDYVEAITRAVLHEIWRVHWNNTGTSFDEGYLYVEHPTVEVEIPGVEVRPFDWSWDDEYEDMPPNLSVSGVSFWMYKYWGRGMECSVEKSPDEWVVWFNEAIATIRSAERPLFGKESA